MALIRIAHPAKHKKGKSDDDDDDEEEEEEDDDDELDAEGLSVSQHGLFSHIRS